MALSQGEVLASSVSWQPWPVVLSQGEVLASSVSWQPTPVALSQGEVLASSVSWQFWPVDLSQGEVLACSSETQSTPITQGSVPAELDPANMPATLTDSAPASLVVVNARKPKAAAVKKTQVSTFFIIFSSRWVAMFKQTARTGDC